MFDHCEKEDSIYKTLAIFYKSHLIRGLQGIRRRNLSVKGNVVTRSFLEQCFRLICRLMMTVELGGKIRL